jgi:hypothetical protein
VKRLIALLVLCGLITVTSLGCGGETGKSTTKSGGSSTAAEKKG